MHRRALFPFMLIWALWPAVAAERRYDEAVKAVSVKPVDRAEEGSGFLITSGGRCILVTAAHVVADAAALQIGRPDGAPLTIAADHTRKKALDVALVPVDVPAADCPAAPTSKDIARASQGTAGFIVVGLPGGKSNSVPVEITGRTDDKLSLRATSSSFPIRQGMSGAALVMSDVPVAILSDASTQADGTASAVRLDYAAQIFGPRVLSLTVVVVQAVDDVTRSIAVLRDVTAARPTTDMGQVAAVQALARAQKGIAGLDLSGIGFDGLQVDGLEAKDVDLRLASLRGARIIDGDMSGANLSLATLDGAILSGTRLDGGGARLLQAAKLDAGRASLRGVGWLAANLRGASFRGADLSGASLAFSDLRDADFRGAKFDHLVLVGADLRGARFDHTEPASIDVTAALFDDATFPPALRSKLCATRNSGAIELAVFETREDASINPGSDNIASDQGALGIPKTAERLFPPCPKRPTIAAASERTGVFALAEWMGDGSKPEMITSRLRATVPTALVAKANRRARVRSIAAEFVKRFNDQIDALPRSNAMYIDRERRIVDAITRATVELRQPAGMWLDGEARYLLEQKLGMSRATPEQMAPTRLNHELRLLKVAGTDIGAYETWPLVFPRGTTEDDLSPPVKAAFTRWDEARLKLLPSRMLVQTLPLPDTAKAAYADLYDPRLPNPWGLPAPPIAGLPAGMSLLQSGEWVLAITGAAPRRPATAVDSKTSRLVVSATIDGFEVLPAQNDGTPYIVLRVHGLESVVDRAHPVRREW